MELGYFASSLSLKVFDTASSMRTIEFFHLALNFIAICWKILLFFDKVQLICKKHLKEKEKTSNFMICSQFTISRTSFRIVCTPINVTRIAFHFFCLVTSVGKFLLEDTEGIFTYISQIKPNINFVALLKDIGWKIR
jgi:hypothetical protein